MIGKTRDIDAKANEYFREYFAQMRLGGPVEDIPADSYGEKSNPNEDNAEENNILFFLRLSLCVAELLCREPMIFPELKAFWKAEVRNKVTAAGPLLGQTTDGKNYSNPLTGDN